NSFQEDVEAFGATSFQVRRRPIDLGACDGSDETCPDRRNPAVTPVEAQMLRNLPTVMAVTEMWGDSKPFRYRDRNLGSVGYDALSAEWMETDAGDIYPGRNFTEHENASAAR